MFRFVSVLCIALALLAAAPAKVAARAEDAPYLVIPLEGVFGEDIVTEGVAKALEHARDTHVQHIVFAIDSPGGYVSTARQIVELMKKNDGFTYHAVVTRAVSASIWIAFACDRIYFREGATLGGAVAYTMTLNNAEVDAKMSSILAAEVRALAEKKKHPSAIVDALMIMDATVAAWKLPSGEVRFAPQLPPGVPYDQVIFTDGKDTVLTITSKVAVEIGLGLSFDGKSLDDLGRVAKIDGWRCVGADYAKDAMRRVVKMQKQRLKEAKEILDQMATYERDIDAAIAEARKVDPANGTYYRGPDGKLTPESHAEWQDRSKACMSALRQARDAHDEWTDRARRLKTKAKALGVDIQINQAKLDEFDRNIAKALQQLHAQKSPG